MSFPYDDAAKGGKLMPKWRNAMRPSPLLLLPFLALSGCGGVSTGEQGTTVQDSQTAELETPATFKPWQGPGTYVMIAPPELDAEQWRIEAKRQCADREFCKVAGWASEYEAATGFPLTEQQMETQVFSYEFDRLRGLDRTLWDCSLFPRKLDDECLLNLSLP